MTKLPALKPIVTISLVFFLTASFGGETLPTDNASTEEREVARHQTETQHLADSEQLWQDTGLMDTEISLDAFRHAWNGYRQLMTTNGSEIGDRLIIIDFSQPSDKERMVIYNVQENTVEQTSLVAHGRNSGEHMATAFSNIKQSYQSSLGFYLTAETYNGRHGYSLRLDGLEAGFNDNARDRAIVIHGADYVSKEFVGQHGRLGRSLGCPSLPSDMSAEIIDMIKDSNLLFIYADNEDYLGGSSILNEQFALNGR